MRNAITTTILLSVFALVGTGLVAFTHYLTKDRIADQKRQFLLRELNSLLPTKSYDNKLTSDIIKVNSEQYLGTQKSITIYRARKGNKPVAALFKVIAPDGYNGNIVILVGIYFNGTLAGIRVIDHQETPGLGDVIEHRKSDWGQRSFREKSLTNPGTHQWKVRKDGGVFDQFTGATITPRAVVKAVHKALQYHKRNKQKLYAPPVKKVTK